jgi:hypothetical protein
MRAVFTFLAFMLLVPAIALAEGEAPSSLDNRINSLQDSRDCIDAAKTKDAIERCRSNIKIAKKELRQLRKAARKELKSNPPAATPSEEAEKK